MFTNCAREIIDCPFFFLLFVSFVCKNETWYNLKKPLLSLIIFKPLLQVFDPIYFQSLHSSA